MIPARHAGSPIARKPACRKGFSVALRHEIFLEISALVR
jgi:hypothetical protein